MQGDGLTSCLEFVECELVLSLKQTLAWISLNLYAFEHVWTCLTLFVVTSYVVVKARQHSLVWSLVSGYDSIVKDVHAERSRHIPHQTHTHLNGTTLGVLPSLPRTVQQIVCCLLIPEGLAHVRMASMYEVAFLCQSCIMLFCWQRERLSSYVVEICWLWDLCVSVLQSVVETELI